MIDLLINHYVEINIFKHTNDNNINHETIKRTD